jgi:hypothetical protein
MYLFGLEELAMSQHLIWYKIRHLAFIWWEACEYEVSLIDLIRDRGDLLH